MIMVEIDAAQFEQPENALSLVKQLKKYGIQVAQEDWTIRELVSVLKTADQAYYNDGDVLTTKVRQLYQEVITDSIYDELVDILRERSPNNKYLNKVGAELQKSPTSHASQRMTKLPFPMASLDKIKPDNAQKWFDKIKEVVVSDKVDGISMGITSDGKGNIKLLSRGNGEIGQDVSYLLPHIPSLKKIAKTKKKFQIRGELVMPKASFTKYAKEYANPRNLMSGIVNKGSISKAFKDAEFIGYAVISPSMKPVEAFEFLDTLVETPHWKVIKNPTVDKISSYLEQRRVKAKYDIDGLVVTDTSVIEKPTHSNPKSSKAFKMQFEDQTTEAIVKEVQWNIGKTGSLIPKIIIEPVRLDGVTIRNATAHNAKFVKDEKLGPGAVILLTRSGGVIPKILEVIKPAKKAQLPDNLEYTWNGVHLVLSDTANSSDIDEMNIKRIANFYKVLGVESISNKTFEKLYEHGYNDVFKIAKITVNKLLDLPGFQKTSATNTYKTINQALQEVPLHLAMYGSSCFNRLLGVKRLEQIVNEIPSVLKDTNLIKLKNNISALEGFNEKTASAFINGLNDFKEFLSKLEKVANVVFPKKKRVTGNKLHNQVIVFTGFRDKNLSELIIKNGGSEGSSVNSKTTILVVKSKSSTSSKMDKAKQLNVKIMDKDEFETWLKKLGVSI